MANLSLRELSAITEVSNPCLSQIEREVVRVVASRWQPRLLVEANGHGQRMMWRVSDFDTDRPGFHNHLWADAFAPHTGQYMSQQRIRLPAESKDTHDDV